MRIYISKYIAFIALIFVLSSYGCKKDSPVSSGVATSAPQIVSLTATKDSIDYGGNEPTVITCVANGGNLAYEWKVDLGNIFVLNSDNSQVRFTGSPCCIGKKYISCKVSNDKGSILDTMVIFIRKP